MMSPFHKAQARVVSSWLKSTDCTVLPTFILCSGFERIVSPEHKAWVGDLSLVKAEGPAAVNNNVSHMSSDIVCVFRIILTPSI